MLDSAQVVKLARSGVGVRVHVRSADRATEVVGSHLLLALGRVPNTERLDLAAAGIEADPQGYIKVNSRLETSAPSIFAIGDVEGGPAFAHISYDDFRACCARADSPVATRRSKGA